MPPTAVEADLHLIGWIVSQVRSASAAVEVQGLLYVLGGYNPNAAMHGEGHDDRLSLVERYDPRTNTWERVS
jgi:N-acetylneuraminic acid mutarotase